MVKRLIFVIFGGLLTALLFAQSLQLQIASASKEQVLSQESMSLADRYPNAFVNNAFKENILLTLGYLSGRVTSAKAIDWNKINQPFHYEMTLSPGQVFAFHDEVLPEFNASSLITTHAHFDAAEGFLYDGDLYGDGVCHLASLLNWTAQSAGLFVVAPTNHNFANIPDIPMQYGTAIYTSPTEYTASALQNLYIKNTFDTPVRFVLDYNDDKLTATIYKDL